jgi:hypothetical protein
MTVVPSTDSNTKGNDEGGSQAGPVSGRLRRIATVITLLLMLGTGSVATAAAASAGTGASATVCFRHDTGEAYTYAVYAQTYANGQWLTVGSTQSVDGCSTWTLASGQYVKFVAFVPVGNRHFKGESGWALTAEGQSWDYHTNYVYMY